jgi:hypothetical protein
MKPKMTDNEHIALLKDAIDANLTARVEYDKRQRPPSKIEFVKFDDDDWARLRLEAIIRNPVEIALRRQLKELGKELYRAVGSTKTMVAICQDVAARDPKKEGYRSNIIDKAWDGVGREGDIWVS